MDALLRRYLEHPEVKSYLKAASLDPVNPDNQPIATELIDTIQTILSSLAFDVFSSSTDQMMVLNHETLTRKLVQAYKTGLPHWPAANNISFNPITHLRYAGLIKSNPETGFIEFAHLTFGEYFAALHLLNMMIANEYNAREFIKSLTKDLRFYAVFPFVSGLMAVKYPQYLSRFFEALFEQSTTQDVAFPIGHNQDMQKVYLLIACLQESGIDHAWSTENNILAFLGNAFYDLIYFGDETLVKDSLQFLSRYPRISLKINFQGHIGPHRIALAVANAILSKGGSSVPERLFSLVENCSAVANLTNHELFDWLNFALNTMLANKNSHDDMELCNVMMKLIVRIVIRLDSNSIEIFERILRCFETDLKNMLFSEWLIQAGFFCLCDHYAIVITDQQINRILVLTESIIPTFKDMDVLYNTEAFFEFFVSIINIKTIKFSSVARTLENLVQTFCFDIRFSVTQKLIKINIDPTQDEQYFAWIKYFSQQADRNVWRGLLNLFSAQTDFVERQWDNIKPLILNFLLDTHVSLRKEIITTFFNILHNKKIRNSPEKMNFIMNQLLGLINRETIKRLFLELQKVLETNHPFNIAEKELLVYTLLQHIMYHNDFSQKIKLEGSKIIFPLETIVIERFDDDRWEKLYHKYRVAPYSLDTEHIDHVLIRLCPQLVLTDKIIIPKLGFCVEPQVVPEYHALSYLGHTSKLFYHQNLQSESNLSVLIAVQTCLYNLEEQKFLPD